MSGLRTTWRWLVPGMHVKRWIILIFAGLFVFLIGIGVIVQAHGTMSKPMALRMAEWLLKHSVPGMRPGNFGVFIKRCESKLAVPLLFHVAL